MYLLSTLLLVFQFQNGAIIRRSTYERIIDCEVSIPKWCDYKFTTNTFGLGGIQFQFQNGAIISTIVGLVILR